MERPEFIDLLTKSTKRDPEEELSLLKQPEERNFGAAYALIMLAALLCGNDPLGDDEIRDALEAFGYDRINPRLHEVAHVVSCIIADTAVHIGKVHGQFTTPEHIRALKDNMPLPLKGKLTYGEQTKDMYER